MPETVECPKCGKETTHFKRIPEKGTVMIWCSDYCQITYTEQDKVTFNKKERKDAGNN